MTTAPHGDQRTTRSTTLAPEPVSASRARAFVADALAALGMHEHVAVAALVVSELVTNAVVHADGEMTLRVRAGAVAVRLEVVDTSPLPPVVRPPDVEAEAGRGLLLVSELANAWGVETLDGAKCVWAELAVDPGGRAGLGAMRERAVVATDVSFTIADATRPDSPLVWVNAAFTRTTGYMFDDAVGRNCRFLQGPDTDPDVRRRIRDAVAARRPTTEVILNYRKDGTAFWNELTLSPVYDDAGRLVQYVGVQADVTAQVQAEQQREAALRAERAARAEAEAARAEAEAAQRRMAVLAEATTLLTATLDVDESLQRLAELCVPIVADWCTVDLVEEGGRSLGSYSSHADPAVAARLLDVFGPTGGPRALPALQRGALDRREAVLVEEVDGGDLAALLPADVLGATGLGDDVCSAIIVPLRARRRVLGTLTLLSTSRSGRAFAEQDLMLAADLGRRAALSVDNARLYTREHRVAETLQRSLLPELPSIDVLDVAARYLARTAGVDVGGDWYDVLRLPDGAVGLAIGDVMGHDLQAAATMGQLRSIVRGYASEGDPPERLLERTDATMQGLELPLATAVYARMTGGGSRWRLEYANAGHLPPLLRTPDGAVEILDGGASVLLGSPITERRTAAEATLTAGATLVLYTDGLIERRRAAINDGLSLLAATVAEGPGDDASALCDHVLERLVGPSLEDDVALLAVRVP